MRNLRIHPKHFLAPIDHTSSSRILLHVGTRHPKWKLQSCLQVREGLARSSVDGVKWCELDNLLSTLKMAQMCYHGSSCSHEVSTQTLWCWCHHISMEFQNALQGWLGPLIVLHPSISCHPHRDNHCLSQGNVIQLWRAKGRTPPIGQERLSGFP